MNKEDDFFSHKKIARSMSKIFSDTYKDGTYVVAINGAWGTGKTNLMNSILSDLDDMEYIKVNFNAWRYAGQEDVKRALLICILEECKRYLRNETNRENLGWQEKEVEYVEQVYEDIERSLYTAFVKEIPGEISIDMGNLLRSGVNLALKFVPWGELGGEFISKLLVQKDTEGIGEDDIDELWNVFKRSSIKRNIEKVTGVEQFRKSFENLMEIIIEGNCEEKKTKSLLRLHNKNIKVVVAIDDLDRCLPETALEILESIKLFMDYPNTYFIIALDGNIIQEGLNIRYQECDSVKIRAKDYYEKMIDLSFNIPALLNDKMYEYIQSLSNESTKYIKLYDLLYIALGTNLRGWQRYIQRTDFNKKLLEDIAGTDIFEDEMNVQIYMKLQCFSYQWPELYREIHNMENYILLEKKIKQIVDYPNKQLEEIKNSLNISANIVNSITDKNILDFILKEPLLKEAENSHINTFFTFDKVS